MWTHGGPTEPPSVLECQFLPNLALLLSGAESCIIGCYFCAAAAEMGELGAASEHQPFSTHVLSGYALHVHAKCSFPPAAPRGRGPQAEPQPLEGIWRTSDQRVAGVWPEDEPAMPAVPLWHAARSVIAVPFSFCLSAAAPGHSELEVCRKHCTDSSHGWTAASGQ